MKNNIFKNNNKNNNKNIKNNINNNKNNKGFTLVEILVVTALVGVVVATSTQLFARILRANEKARAILEVKQEGDNALATLVYDIRNADEIVEDSCTSTDIELNNDDVIANTVYDCFNNRIRVTVDTETNYLTSADLITTCESLFTCYSDLSGNPDIVEINFNLAKDEDDDGLNFSTTVSLRSY